MQFFYWQQPYLNFNFPLLVKNPIKSKSTIEQEGKLL